jgi:hypothetical protein
LLQDPKVARVRAVTLFVDSINILKIFRWNPKVLQKRAVKDTEAGENFVLGSPKSIYFEE